MRHALLVFAAAIALTASGCDSTGIDAPSSGGTPTPPTGTPAPPTGTPGTSTQTFALVVPAATYLRTNEGTLAAAPIRLSDYGVVPGDVACFRAVGDATLGGGQVASANSVRLTGTFSATTTLSATSELNRIKDAIDGSWDVVTLPVTSSGLPSNIDEDFDATNNCWPVPGGAVFAFFSVYDGYFPDNVDANAGGQPFGVLISKQ